MGTSPKNTYEWKMIIWKDAQHHNLLEKCNLNNNETSLHNPLESLHYTKYCPGSGKHRTHTLLAGMWKGTVTLLKSLILS